MKHYIAKSRAKRAALGTKEVVFWAVCLDGCIRVYANGAVQVYKHEQQALAMCEKLGQGHYIKQVALIPTGD
ncbi:MAG: hypothetical protein ACK5MY_02640 [Jhaorihella sp.]